MSLGRLERAIGRLRGYSVGDVLEAVDAFDAWKGAPRDDAPVPVATDLPFWMLYVEGGRAPTFRHDTPEGAKREAERLAVQTGKRVYVLEAIASCVKNDVTWEKSPSRADEDIPF